MIKGRPVQGPFFSSFFFFSFSSSSFFFFFLFSFGRRDRDEVEETLRQSARIIRNIVIAQRDY